MSVSSRTFVSFTIDGAGYRAVLEVSGIGSLASDPETLLCEVAAAYGDSIERLRTMIANVEQLKKERKPVWARSMWQLGDQIVRLRGYLACRGLEIDDLYGHLVNHLGVKRSWLEKIVIFRSYIGEEGQIPALLNWGKCAQSPKRSAIELCHGSLAH